MRRAEALGLAEVPSTRLLVETGRLIAAGMPPRVAARAALVEPLSDDIEVLNGLSDAVALVF